MKKLVGNYSDLDKFYIIWAGSSPNPFSGTPLEKVFRGYSGPFPEVPSTVPGSLGEVNPEEFLAFAREVASLAEGPENNPGFNLNRLLGGLRHPIESPAPQEAPEYPKGIRVPLGGR
jgi:hypothetical protein